MQRLRQPAVAGLFYPADAAVLRQQVDDLLAGARAGAQPAAGAAAPKALIVPHAGYVYSGAVAASGYARLGSRAARIRTVVLLGPAHRVAVRGLALPAAARFATPLGDVEIDGAAIARIRDLPQVVVSDAAHAMEHSLEVHLPFLQRMLPQFRLVPLVVGQASAGEVAEVLDRLWGGEETLIVVSSDLSHYLPYAQARERDGATAQVILAQRTDIDPEQACGAYPINGLLRAAPAHGLHGTLLDLRNSGDTAGERSRVVGYAAFAFAPTATEHARTTDASSAAHTTGAAVAAQGCGRELLAIARGAIAEQFGAQPLAVTSLPALELPGASFVTLMREGSLRGCIGSLEAHRPLREDVRHNARAAAFADPRFPPLAFGEFAGLRVEVSVLGAPAPLAATSEDEALASLRPGVDGIVLQLGARRATFLPQVWEQLPDARRFLQELKRKAGLPVDFWSNQLRLSRYAVSKYREDEQA